MTDICPITKSFSFMQAQIDELRAERDEAHMEINRLRNPTETGQLIREIARADAALTRVAELTAALERIAGDSRASHAYEIASDALAGAK